MSLLFYMFQSILNTFVLGYLIGGKKLIIFTDGGYPPPFAENSAKIINLIFAPFPYWATNIYKVPPTLEKETMRLLKKIIFVL